MREIAQRIAGHRNREIVWLSPRLPENPCQRREPAEPQRGGEQVHGLIELMGDPGGAVVHSGVSDPTEACEQSQRATGRPAAAAVGRDRPKRGSPRAANANTTPDRSGFRAAPRLLPRNRPPRRAKPPSRPPD